MAEAQHQAEEEALEKQSIAEEKQELAVEKQKIAEEEQKNTEEREELNREKQEFQVEMTKAKAQAKLTKVAVKEDTQDESAVENVKGESSGQEITPSSPDEHGNVVLDEHKKPEKGLEDAHKSVEGGKEAPLGE